jgi:hypothetical protein
MNPQHAEKAAQLMMQRHRLVEGLKRIKEAPGYNGILKVAVGGWDVIEIWREGSSPPPMAEKVGKKGSAELTYLLKHVKIAFEMKVARLDAQLRRIGVDIGAPRPKKKRARR